ncbi:MAG TPA: hypothetical protein VF189_03790 [Patescibacteria group bacterium]
MALWNTTPLCSKGWEQPAPTLVKDEFIQITTGNGRVLRQDNFPVCQGATPDAQSKCSAYEPRRDQQNQPK